MNIKNLLKKLAPIKVGILVSLLGAYGGQGYKSYRRMGIPVFITILALLYLKHWGCIFIMSMVGAFSVGYGIPCLSDPDPSSIGKFWYKIVTALWYQFFLYTIPIQIIDSLVNMLTRCTIALMVNLSLLPIPIIKGNWLIYLIGSLSIILGYALLSWRDLGVIKTKTGHLLWSDLITYGIIGSVSGALIYF